MKSYKKFLPIFLIAAFLITAGYSFKTKMDQSASYEAALEQARFYAGNKIAADAISAYETALSIRPNLAVAVEAGEVYLEEEDLVSAKSWYQKQLLAKYPLEPETYLYGVRLYLASGNYRDAFDVYDDYQRRGLFLQDVEDEMDQVRYRYDLSGLFEDAGVFSNITNTAPVMYGGMWGYVDNTGKRMITYDYLEADSFSTYASVLQADGTACYIDANGDVKINQNLILEKDPDFGAVKAFQPIQSGMILASNGELWNYYSAQSFEKLFGGFRGAWPVTTGVGAVSEDGGKWALINENGERLTEYIFDELVADQKDVICRTDALVARQNGKYILIDKSGKQLSDGGFDKAFAFYDDSYAAFGNGQNWSFLDKTGACVLTGTYQDARSFSNGLAAVKIDGAWGYIDAAGNLAIPCEFEEAGPFNNTGVAFVKQGENWKMLKLYQYNH